MIIVKKFLLAFCFIVPLFLKAQDCKLNRETDPFTKETKISSGFIPLKNASVIIDATSSEIDFLFTLEGNDKCFDNNSTAAIFFEGTKVKMTNRNGGSMNCEGLFHFIFRNTNTQPSLLNKLATQKIDHIVFTGNNKKETIIAFNPKEQEAMMMLSNCLASEAKSLIKLP